MKLKIRNNTQQLVMLTKKDGEILPLLPRGEQTIDADQKSQDILIKEERGIVNVSAL